MRKIFSFLMSVAVAATTFVGCTNTEINIDSTPTPTPTGTYRQLTFSTEQDASRTHHNGETIIWSKGDKIRIGYTKGDVWQNADGREKGDTSTAKLYASNELGSDCEYSKFTLTTRFKDTDATGPIIFYGLYPSNITKGNESDFAESDKGTINVVLPQIQSPAATSFDSNADLMVSKSVKTYEALPTYEEHISMYWTRLVTHGMITLKNLTAAGMTADEKVQYVTIEADADDALTGDFTLDIDDKTLTPTDGKNQVRLSYANTDYNTLDGEGNFVVWFATAPFTATDLTITVGTDKATYTREITPADKITFVVNKRNKLGINMAEATRVEIETEENWMMVQDKTKFVDGITVIIAKMFGSDGNGPALSTDEKGTSGSITVSKDRVNGTYSATNVGNDIQQFKLGVNPEASGQYSFQALNGDNTGQYLWTRATTNNGDLYYVQEEKFWEVDTGAFDGGSTQLGKGGVVPVGNSVSVSLAYYNSAFCVRNIFNVDGVSPITLYYNATALPSLSAPVIYSDKDKTKQTDEGNAVQVVWKEVENALSYTITATCEGKEDIVVKNITDTTDTTDMTYTVDGFVEGTWTITVTAEADYHKSATSAGVNVEVIDKTPRITVEPTELAFTSAGDTKSITVETSYFGANVEISAESDNNAFDVSVDVSVDGTTVSVTAGANETDAVIGGTITVTATDGATTLTADVTVQQAAKSNATAEWQLLTDLRSLQTEGLEVVIAAAGYDVAISTTQNKNNRGQATITKSGNTLSSIGADVQIFQLQQGTTSGTWAFFDDTLNGYLYAASSGENYLRTQKTNNGNGSWTITVTNNVASIVAQGANTRNVMQYNSNNSLFSCYSSASQEAVAIYYRLASTEPRINSVSTDKTEFEHDGSTTINATVATKYAAGETLNVTFDGDWVTIDPTTVTVGDYNTATFALTAAENTANESRTITMTVSLNGSSKQLTFTQKAAPLAATGWALLTDVNTLKPGMEVVITANTANRVLGALSDEFFTAVSGVTFSDDKSTITALPADAIIFTIGGTTGAYTFSCDSGLLGSSSATKNQWNGDNTTWTLTPNNGNVDIISVGTDGKLQYNTAATRFKNYTSSQGEVQIYYRGEGSGEFPITPSLTVTPTSLTWEADATEEQQITVTANGEWSHIKSGMDWATVSVSGDVITVTPKAANTATTANEGTITISMAGVNDVVVNCSQAGVTQSGGGEGGSDHVYTKVTSAPADWSGQYLIVYEGESFAFDGSLTTLDAVSNYKTVTIENNQISLSASEDTFYFTIAKTSNGYSIKSASGTYIGRTANSNGFNTSTTSAIDNTISYSSSKTVINGTGSGASKSLLFNKQSGQTRFRFLTSGEAIQLYKLEGDGGNAGGGEEPETPTTVTESLNIYGTNGTKSSDSSSISWTGTNFTVTNVKGSTAIRTSDNDHYRVYANSTLKFTASNGKTFTKIVITCPSGYADELQSALGSSATISGNVVTWTGSATEVSGKPTAQTRISKVEATLQ